MLTIADMELRLPAQRLEDRAGLLRQLDRLRRHADRSRAIENLSFYQQQAYTARDRPDRLPLWHTATPIAGSDTPPGPVPWE